MREKILAELLKKYPGLPKSFLGQLADSIGKKVTEESGIEGAVNELENLPIPLTQFATTIQTEGDRRVTEALKKAKTEKKAGDNEDIKTDDNPLNGADANNPMMKLLTELTKKVDNMTQEKSKQTMTEKLYAKLKEKKLPEFLAKGRIPEKEEDLDTAVADIEKDWNDHRQANADDQLGKTTTPGGGTGVTVTDSVAAEDIKGWAAGKKSQAGAATSKN